MVSENKKTTATITFHASHNYGSMLQAYALQQTLLGLGVENEIINFRPQKQKKCYPYPKDHYYNSGLTGWMLLKRRIAGLIEKPFIGDYCRKFERFEAFLKDNLRLTPELEEINCVDSRVQRYDYYITGSDQCWNTDCWDFDWAYFLDFSESLNKISYASSFGPNIPHVHQERIAERVNAFKSVSVREQSAADFLMSITDREYEVMPDPTLLLTSSDWDRLIDSEPLIAGDYILVYSPGWRNGLISFAERLSKIHKLPIIFSNSYGARQRLRVAFNKNVRYRLDAGPREFLNLMKNARYAVCGSFHAIVFALIFKVPFFAIGGGADNRMKTLLTKFGLMDRVVDGNANKSFDDIIFNEQEMPDSDEIMTNERRKAFAYLSRALDL